MVCWWQLTPINMHGMCVCALLCVTVSCRRCSRYLEWTSEVLPLGLYIWCQVIMVQMNTQKPTADCASEWTDLSYKSMCTRNTFHFSVTQFPFHISILLGVAEINLSRFGISLLCPPVLCPKSRGMEAIPRGICCGFAATELSFLVLGLQWSVCLCHRFSFFQTLRFLHVSPSSAPSMWFACTRASHAMLVVRDWTFVSGLSCHVQQSLLLQCLPGALPEEVAQLLSVLRFCKFIRCSFITLFLWVYLVVRQDSDYLLIDPQNLHTPCFTDFLKSLSMCLYPCVGQKGEMGVWGVISWHFVIKHSHSCCPYLTFFLFSLRAGFWTSKAKNWLFLCIIPEAINTSPPCLC